MERKKAAFLGALSIVATLYLFVVFAPIFGLTISDQFVYMNIIEYVQKVGDVLKIVGVFAGPIVSIPGIVMLWMAFLGKDNDQGDLKDKRYLMGTLIFVLGAVISGVNGIASGTYIHMLISVLLALIYGALIYVHNKYLTTY